jgi:hypothetical protein
MGLPKRTYALPPQTLERFEQEVAPGRRSAVIAELLQAWLERGRRERLRCEVVAGCREMAGVYLEVEREYHALEEEAHRALGNQSKAGRRRSN